MQDRSEHSEPGERPESNAAGTVIWCGACAIPYASATVYCANCGALLAADTGAPAGETFLPTIAPPLRAETGGAPATPMIAASALPPPVIVAPRVSGGFVDRIRQRQHVMSEAEVDAAAAAIIARAREVEDSTDAVSGPRGALDFLPDISPDPAIEVALQRRRERDRLWLIAGVICCVALIIFALVVSRYMSIGLLRR